MSIAWEKDEKHERYLDEINRHLFELFGDKDANVQRAAIKAIDMILQFYDDETSPMGKWSSTLLVKLLSLLQEGKIIDRKTAYLFIILVFADNGKVILV
jgi:hypothetical protein